MGNPIVGQGDVGMGQDCVHWDPAEPGLSSPSASGTAAQRVLGCSGGHLQPPPPLPAPTSVLPLRKMLEMVFPCIISLWLILNLEAQRGF